MTLVNIRDSSGDFLLFFSEQASHTVKQMDTACKRIHVHSIFGGFGSSMYHVAIITHFAQ